jgi:hypothetical protein
MAQSKPASKQRRRKRVHLGDGLWETKLDNGELLWEIPCTPEQRADLQAEADEHGLTLEEVAHQRIFGEPDPRLFDRLLSGYQEQAATIIKDLKMTRDAIRGLAQRREQLPVPLDTVLCLTSA